MTQAGDGGGGMRGGPWGAMDDVPVWRETELVGDGVEGVVVVVVMGGGEGARDGGGQSTMEGDVRCWR